VTSSPRVSSFTKDRHPVTTSRFNAARPTLSICATAGLTLLRAHGIRARRLEDGFLEWRLAGMPVEVG
jgi:hypothetical protein